MFRDETERQRAREAGIAALRQWHGPNGGAETGWANAFDRLYPPVVEAPAPAVPSTVCNEYCGCPKPATPSPAFAAAVEAYGNARVYESRQSPSGIPYYADGPVKLDAARARVLALYAERQGEEYEVLEADIAYGPHKHLGAVTTTIVNLNDYEYKPGDRVLVSRVEGI